MGKTSPKAVKKYTAKTYDRKELLVRKEIAPQIYAHIEKRGESFNGFALRSMLEQIRRDNETVTSD